MDEKMKAKIAERLDVAREQLDKAMDKLTETLPKGGHTEDDAKTQAAIDRLTEIHCQIGEVWASFVL
jgi:hypothetical protein